MGACASKEEGNKTTEACKDPAGPNRAEQGWSAVTDGPALTVTVLPSSDPQTCQYQFQLQLSGKEQEELTRFLDDLTANNDGLKTALEQAFSDGVALGSQASVHVCQSSLKTPPQLWDRRSIARHPWHALLLSVVPGSEAGGSPTVTLASVDISLPDLPLLQNQGSTDSHHLSIRAQPEKQATHSLQAIGLAAAEEAPLCIAVCSQDGREVLYQNRAARDFSGVRCWSTTPSYLRQLFVFNPALLKTLLSKVGSESGPWSYVIPVPGAPTPGGSRRVSHTTLASTATTATTIRTSVRALRKPHSGNWDHVYEGLNRSHSERGIAPLPASLRGVSPLKPSAIPYKASPDRSPQSFSVASRARLAAPDARDPSEPTGSTLQLLERLRGAFTREGTLHAAAAASADDSPLSPSHVRSRLVNQSRTALRSPLQSARAATADGIAAADGLGVQKSERSVRFTLGEARAATAAGNADAAAAGAAGAAPADAPAAAPPRRVKETSMAGSNAYASNSPTRQRLISLLQAGGSVDTQNSVLHLNMSPRLRSRHVSRSQLPNLSRRNSDDDLKSDTGPSRSVTDAGTASVYQAGTEASRDWVEPCWHEVIVSSSVHPDTGAKTLLVCHRDVTVRFQTEEKLIQLTEAQLIMLENLFPRHILERIAKAATADACRKSNPGAHAGADMLALTKELTQQASQHECVTIMFTDIVGFTSMSREVQPEQVMRFLNELFSKFDELAVKHKVSKVETAGDCYIVCAGLLHEDEQGFKTLALESDQAASQTRAARRVLNFAVEMMHVAKTVTMPHNGQPVQQRVGIHSGPIVSGLIGQLLPKFALFGDTMNTASRMESTSLPGRIQVSEETYQLLADRSGNWESTGGIEVKGKGTMQTWLLSERAMDPSGSGRFSLDTRHNSPLSLSGRMRSHEDPVVMPWVASSNTSPNDTLEAMPTGMALASFLLSRMNSVRVPHNAPPPAAWGEPSPTCGQLQPRGEGEKSNCGAAWGNVSSWLPGMVAASVQRGPPLSPPLGTVREPGEPGERLAGSLSVGVSGEELVEYDRTSAPPLSLLTGPHPVHLGCLPSPPHDEQQTTPTLAGTPAVRAAASAPSLGVFHPPAIPTPADKTAPDMAAGITDAAEWPSRSHVGPVDVGGVGQAQGSAVRPMMRAHDPQWGSGTLPVLSPVGSYQQQSYALGVGAGPLGAGVLSDASRLRQSAARSSTKSSQQAYSPAQGVSDAGYGSNAEESIGAHDA